MKNKVLSISLAVMLALSVGLIGCGAEEAPEIPEYNLTISSTEGGEVTTPGEGTSTRDEGEVVNLVATPDVGYQFDGWTGDITTIAGPNDANTAITMNGDYTITANFKEIMEQQYIILGAPLPLLYNDGISAYNNIII